MDRLNNIDKTPLLVVILFGVWGAFLNYTNRELDPQNRSMKIKIMHFLIDFASSTGLSMLTFLGLEGYGFNELLSVAIAGFVAHQGTRAIYLVELIITEKAHITVNKK